MSAVREQGGENEGRFRGKNNSGYRRGENSTEVALIEQEA